MKISRAETQSPTAPREFDPEMMRQSRLASVGEPLGSLAANSHEDDSPSPIRAELDLVEDLHKATQDNFQRGEAALGDVSAMLQRPKRELLGSNQVATDAEIVQNFEQQRAVKRPPKFVDMLRDKDRTKKFSVFTREKNDRRSMTELQGLRELNSFLTMFRQHSIKAQEKSPTVKEEVVQAASIQEHLTFIGEKEYREAARGIGLRWKSYLEDNPNHKLCLLTETAGLSRYAGFRKSDSFLKEQILQTFTNEELDKYSGRIVERIDDVESADPQDVKVVMLDDWAISGTQVRDVFRKSVKDTRFKKLQEAGRVEINNIVASEGRIKEGFVINPYERNPQKVTTLPVYAYYQAHHAPDAHTEAKGHITGLHCAVNFDFSNNLRSMHRMLGSKKNRIKIPGLAFVSKSYRFAEPTLVVEPDKITKTTEFSQVAA